MLCCTRCPTGQGADSSDKAPHHSRMQRTPAVAPVSHCCPARYKAVSMLQKAIRHDAGAHGIVSACKPLQPRARPSVNSQPAHASAHESTACRPATACGEAAGAERRPKVCHTTSGALPVRLSSAEEGLCTSPLARLAAGQRPATIRAACTVRHLCRCQASSRTVGPDNADFRMSCCCGCQFCT